MATHARRRPAGRPRLPFHHARFRRPHTPGSAAPDSAATTDDLDTDLEGREDQQLVSLRECPGALALQRMAEHGPYRLRNKQCASYVNSLQFLGGELLLGGAVNGSVCLWDVGDPLDPRRAHWKREGSTCITALARLGEDGDFVAASAAGEGLAVYNAEQSKATDLLDPGGDGVVLACAADASGALIAACEGGQLTVWNRRVRRPVFQCMLAEALGRPTLADPAASTGCLGACHSLAFLPGSPHCLLASGREYVSLLDLRLHKSYAQVVLGSSGRPPLGTTHPAVRGGVAEEARVAATGAGAADTGAGFRPPGLCVQGFAALRAAPEAVLVYDPWTSRFQQRFQGHNGGESLTCAGFACASGAAVLTATPFTCKAWDTVSGRGLSTFEGRRRYSSSAIDLRGQVLVRGTVDGAVEAWALQGRRDLGPARLRLPFMSAQMGLCSIDRVAVSPQGTAIATVNSAGTISVLSALPSRD